MADVTISNLNPFTGGSITSSLLLPVTDGTTTGRVTIGNINSLAPVQTVFGRAGNVTLTSSDVTTALGFTPYDSTNPSGYISNTNAAVAKAWVHFAPTLNTSGVADSTNTARLVRSSYNVSGVTRVSSGVYTVNFSSPFANTNYNVHCTARNNIDGAGPAYEVNNPVRTVSNVSVGAYTLGNTGVVNPIAYYVTIFA